MPLIRIDIVEGRRSPEQITRLLDTVHTEMVAAFDTPQRDRYQIVHEHPRHHLVAPAPRRAGHRPGYRAHR